MDQERYSNSHLTMAKSLLARATAITHRGKVRGSNEDAIVVDAWVAQDSMTAPEFSVIEIDRPRLFAVCDGMGGHAAGEVASALVAKSLAANAMFLADASAISERLVSLNDMLFDMMEQDPSTWGMGTTVAGLVLSPESVLIFNVGDSRIYRLQNGYLRQLTVDDTQGNLLADEPYFGYAQENGRVSSKISQALGGATERIAISPHVSVEALYPGSRYVICSDGLTDMADVDTMEGCLRDADDLAAVNCLLTAALEHGGADNVSVMLVTI